MTALATDTPAAPSPIQTVLGKFWGLDELRPLQGEAIDAVLEGRDSLVVMPTGGGKSLCYQVPPAVAGRTDVVVSPLISLMKDQVDALRACGYPAAALHSGLSEQEKTAVIQEMLSGRLRLVFVAPERLLAPAFLGAVGRLGVRAFHIDEAHCISQWGHDFRPEYRRLRELRRAFPDASLHAYTATATPRVRGDIAMQLGLRRPAVLVGRFDRPNLNYQVVAREDTGGQVLGALDRHKDEAAIVYCISRKETEETAAFLRSKSIRAGAYHAGMAPRDRTRVQEDFAAERLDVVVATVAFGMGIDRSNVRCVIHAAMPKSIEHYQQETGRAGRDGLEAECLLLYGRGDAPRWNFILEQSGAPPEVLRAQKALVRDMRGFCESAACRHAQLSRYFGQAYDTRDCGACDVCRPLRRAPAASDAESAAWDGVDTGLFERLRGLRRAIAEERDVPAYIVFSDATLREMARIRPQSLAEMKLVRGIGERKLADLGRRFLGEIRAYCGPDGTPPAAGQASWSAPAGAGSSASTAKRTSFDLFRRGKAVVEVAAAIGRAQSTTRDYLIDFILDARPDDVDAWLPRVLYDRIAAVAGRVGMERLRPVFEALGEQVSYDEIRIALAHIRARAAALATPP